jgi:hypothetical protein
LIGFSDGERWQAVAEHPNGEVAMHEVDHVLGSPGAVEGPSAGPIRGRSRL